MSDPADQPAVVGPRTRAGWATSPVEHGRRGLRWRLDHSLPLRLALALLAAGVLLGAVNRWEHCRSSHFARGCLRSDPGGIISVGNVESLSIVTAALLYLLEGGQRRQRENHQAMELLLACQQAGARLSHARNDALETLSERGIWLDGLDLSRTQLDGLRAPHGRWREVILREASLRQAWLQDCDLQRAVLVDADLSQARLEHADLRGADLRGCDLRGADLRSADLRGAQLEGAQLEGAQLQGARLEGTALDAQNQQALGLTTQADRSSEA